MASRWASFHSANVPGGVQSAQSPWGGMYVREDSGGNIIQHHHAMAHAARPMQASMPSTSIRWGEGLKTIAASGAALYQGVQKIRSQRNARSTVASPKLGQPSSLAATPMTQIATAPAFGTAAIPTMGEPLEWPPKSRNAQFKGTNLT